MALTLELVDVSDEAGRAQVVDALQRALDSPELATSPRSRDFLAYVVTETLAGRGDKLSERTVGRRALRRGPEFDGRTDSSVRVRASRVRSALERYYAGGGADDPVQIVLPAGRYVVEFHRNRGSGPPPVTTVPGVVVLELAAAGGDRAASLAAVAADLLATRLSDFGDIRVIGPTRLRGESWVAARALGVSSVLEGRVSAQGSRARLVVRLLSTSTGAVTWSADEELDLSRLEGFDHVDRWALGVAAELGDTVGVVVRTELREHRTAPASPELVARLAFASYLERGSSESITAAIEAVDAALDDGRTPSLLAMRAALANSARIYAALPDDEAQLELAAVLAREALTLDGRNVHAHLVLGAVAAARRQWDLGVEHAETAVRLRPFHPSYLIGAGITATTCGRWDRGAELIHEGHRLHPAQPAHTRTWLAINHLVHGDDARALAEASLLPSDGGFVWGPLYRALALAGLGYVDQARSEAARAAELRPDVMADPGAYLCGRMNVTEEQAERLRERIERLGA